jgi:hypothetical protein
MPRYYFERALFVVGEPNSGKGNQLRSMFRDLRFGTHGDLPAGKSLDEVHRLSNERSLDLRLTSPHEAKEYIGRKRGRKANFLEKTAEIIAENTRRFGKRWNFAAAVQPRFGFFGMDEACHRLPSLARACGFQAAPLPSRERLL